MKIYVASSWRNPHQQRVVQQLRSCACEVYDFRNPPHGRGGFAWSNIDPAWNRWDPIAWRDALNHPLAVDGYQSDMDGMIWADACVLVLPSGRSSHLEAGWFCGKGKPCVVYAPEPVEPDLMVKMCDRIVTTEEELGRWVLEIMLGSLRKRTGEDRRPHETAFEYIDRLEAEVERRFAAELASQPPGGAQTLGGHRPAGRPDDAVDIIAGVPETTLGVTGKESEPSIACRKCGRRPSGESSHGWMMEKFGDSLAALCPQCAKPNAYLPQGKLPIVGGILDTTG